MWPELERVMEAVKQNCTNSTISDEDIFDSLDEETKKAIARIIYTTKQESEDALDEAYNNGYEDARMEYEVL